MSIGHDLPTPPQGHPGPLAIPPRITRRHEFHHLRSQWCWFLAFGILLVICGSVAVIVPPIATKFAIDVLAAVFLVAGVATIVSSFWAGQWSGLLVQLLVGILYIAAGFVITEKPLGTVLLVTLFISVSFIIAGAFRTLAAVLIRFPQWGWALLNGLVTLLMGIIIYRHLPTAAFWVPGLLVGIEMLLSGWTWVMLAMAIRALPEDATP